MKRQILYLEDEPDVITLVRLVLSQCDCEVLGATSVSQAEEILMQNGIDLFLVDLMMPGENGWDFLDRLALNNRYLETPKIVVTAKAPPKDSRDEKVLANDPRLHTFLIKPFSPKVLLDTVKDALHQSPQALVPFSPYVGTTV